MAEIETASRRSLQDVVDEVIARRVRGEEWTDDQVVATHPELLPQLEGELRKVRRVEQARLAARVGHDDTAHAAPHVHVEGYDILRLINHGGQAMIYLARQRATGNQVALKVLRFGALADDRQRARFEREAQLLASIDHPNIVSVLDRGTTRDGQLFLVMNYIAGEPLNPEKLAGRASLQERLHLFVTICRAVDEAHRLGIIHRDLKPGNVRLDEQGRPHVLDFGLATDRRGSDDLREAMTVTGQFLGSFLWASPEQTEGKCDLTPASDVYALGVMLHQLATGGRFPPQVFESVKRALDPTGRESRFTISAEVHPALAAIIGRCLARKPDARYESAGALADAVERFLAEPAPRRPHARRRWLIAAIAAIAAIALATGLAAFYKKPVSAIQLVNGRSVLHLDRGLNFHWIPPGEFWMGSPLSESERLPDERRHRIRIERGFYILQTEVPQWLYQKVMGTNPSKYQRDDGQLPVESVTWHDAVAFCKAYSKQTGYRVRLPTEAEWEYACRAGTSTKYSFGDDREMMVRYGNFADRSSVKNPGRSLDLDDGCPITAPVHTYLTNAWGLVQMQGNVWEWCLNPYDPYPLEGGVSVDRVPAVLPVAPFAAVARGGSWYDDISSLRCANRCAIESTTRECTLGFRIVCEEMAQP
jgi:serine/threonine protein kinase